MMWKKKRKEKRGHICCLFLSFFGSTLGFIHMKKKQFQVIFSNIRQMLVPEGKQVQDGQTVLWCAIVCGACSTILFLAHISMYLEMLLQCTACLLDMHMMQYDAATLAHAQQKYTPFYLADVGLSHIYSSVRVLWSQNLSLCVFFYTMIYGIISTIVFIL